MIKPSHREIHAFILFVMSLYSDPNYSHVSLLGATTTALSDRERGRAQEFFQSHGFDGARVTTDLLIRCAHHAGWHHSQYTPSRTFADMEEAINQFRHGIVFDAELIGALQLSPVQAKALDNYMALPRPAQCKLLLSDFDAWVETETAKWVS